MVSWKALSAVSLATLVAAAGVARPAVAADCFEAISAASSQKLFDTLAPAKPGDGCVLENVGTDKSQMKIEWTKGGHLQEAILVVPTSCVKVKATPAKLSVIVPPSVAEACPAAVDATKKLVESGTLGEPVTVTEALSIPDLDGRSPRLTKRTIRLLAGGGGLVAALAVGGAVAVWRRRRRRGAATAGSPPEASTTPAAEPAEPAQEP
jgi:hypothetical protein